jgi:hypothetical protein
MRQSEALNEFEAAVIAALAQSPEKTLPPTWCENRLLESSRGRGHLSRPPRDSTKIRTRRRIYQLYLRHRI